MAEEEVLAVVVCPNGHRIRVTEVRTLEKSINRETYVKSSALCVGKRGAPVLFTALTHVPRLAPKNTISAIGRDRREHCSPRSNTLYGDRN
jgi:hypothetical protein